MINKKRIAAVALSLCMATGVAVLAACGNDEQPYDYETRARTGWEDTKQYTYKTYTAQLPSVWTELNTSDANDLELIQYINSSFFEFNYEFDENGEIVPGGFTVDYSAATKLEDVTKDYVGKYGLTEEDAKEGGHAFAITLRDDLEWEDGTPITAADFEYTMQQQLSPNYLFSQASNYYSGNYIIHNAQNYVYQGQSGWFAADTPYTEYDPATLDAKIVFTMASSTENEEKYDGATSSIRASMNAGDMSLENFVAALQSTYSFPVSLEQVKQLEGKTMAQIKADSNLNAVWSTVIGWWQSQPNEELDFFVVEYTYPEMEWDDNVGFFADDEGRLVIVIDNTIHPLDANGDLTYEAAYYLQSFPLVKRELWEKLEDRSSKPWKNAYNTASVANSASWGPYKLTNFQSGTTYTLSRNENWFGYGLEQYAKQYQTDTIEVRYIPEWNTAWSAFQQGDLDGIGLDSMIINEYRTSSRAYFTPETYTYSLNLQSNPAAYTKGKNIMLKYDDFRQALSLSIDRNDYCAVNEPSSTGALGYLNELYYYDVENGGVYRDTDQAKEALLNAYGATNNGDGTWTVGSVTYDDIDEAVNSLTGYNITLARQLMQKAYEEAKAAGDYADGDAIVLTIGVQEETANQERNRAYLENAFNQALVGTPMEGKLKIEFTKTTASNWNTDFMNGKYDICFSAWGSAAFNPNYLLGATQIWDANRLATAWDPAGVSVTLDLDVELDTVIAGAGYEQYVNEDGSITMDLKLWDACLQGLAQDDGGRNVPFNFSAAPTEVQLQILAAEETAILEQYWAIPMFSSTLASLISYKCEYISYEYNTFMGFGGVRYMSFNFDDTEWEAFVQADKDHILNYTF